VGLKKNEVERGIVLTKKLGHLAESKKRRNESRNPTVKPSSSSNCQVTSCMEGGSASNEGHLLEHRKTLVVGRLNTLKNLAH